MTDSITRILVPVDFSAHSDRAVRYAATLASEVGASAELMHVVEDPFRAGAFSSEVYPPNLPEVLDGVIADANRRLATIRDTMFPHGADVGFTVIVGRPDRDIVEQAKAAGCDLIVMGTHGRTGFSHMLMGSVAERVVRMSPCPVLTVRGAETPARDAAAPFRAA